MALILGVDPGLGGAFAVYDTDTRSLIHVADMPTWFVTVNKKKRKRMDSIALAELFDFYQLLGIDMMVIEEVGGRPKQSASSAFSFGFVVGQVYAKGFESRFVLETVAPQQWKKILKIPGKKVKEGGDKKLNEGMIKKRISELFPTDLDKFKGPMGGWNMDRADAACLAKFGGDYIYSQIMDNPEAKRDNFILYNQANA